LGIDTKRMRKERSDDGRGQRKEEGGTAKEAGCWMREKE